MGTFFLLVTIIFGGLFMSCFDVVVMLDEFSFSEIYRKMV